MIKKLSLFHFLANPLTKRKRISRIMKVLGLVLCMMATVALANNGRSDLQCNYLDYSSICDCDYYKSVNCKNYYSSSGQGGSYAPKNFEWDTDCAKCCCNGEYS